MMKCVLRGGETAGALEDTSPGTDNMQDGKQPLCLASEKQPR